MLAGAGFFVEAVSIIRKTLTSAIRCSFGVQTNGTLITEEIVNLFAQEEIHIGLSLTDRRRSMTAIGFMRMAAAASPM